MSLNERALEGGIPLLLFDIALSTCAAYFENCSLPFWPLVTRTGIGYYKPLPPAPGDRDQAGIALGRVGRGLILFPLRKEMNYGPFKRNAVHDPLPGQGGTSGNADR